MTTNALPNASPNLNGRCERFIGTTRPGCLDQTIIIGNWQLDHLLAEFTAYYNETPSHSERDHLPPIRDLPEDVARRSPNQVEVRSYVGGLVKSFEWMAAERLFYHPGADGDTGHNPLQTITSSVRDSTGTCASDPLRCKARDP